MEITKTGFIALWSDMQGRMSETERRTIGKEAGRRFVQGPFPVQLDDLVAKLAPDLAA